jgi:cytidylate kinase
VNNGGDIPVITVDGPGGAGKGTLAGRLARHLGWHLLDSGAIYRLVAHAALQRGVSFDDAVALSALARDLDVRFEQGDDGIVRAFLDGHDVSRAIRTESAGMGASRVAALPAVREALLALQRSFRRPPGLVADGRDMGTVVFPNATTCFFLTADVEERARRRHKQLKEKGVDAKLADLLEEIAERDRRDRERAVAPLKPADGAILLDSTGKDIETVLSEALAALPAQTGGGTETT